MKPVDGDECTAYANSWKAGTPTALTSPGSLVGGARGGGGSNRTGSYSGSDAMTCV